MPSISGSTGPARPGSFAHRGIASCSLLATAVLVTACPQNSERDSLPALVLSPDSALQGAAVSITVVAPGVSLSMCDGAEPNRLTFARGGEPSPIEVMDLEVVDDDSFSARLIVSMSAAIGTHVVSFRCDANTVFEGDFSVRERTEDGTVVLSPSEARAGTSYLRVDITGEDVAFDAEETHVVFGDGDDVTVSETQAADGASAMYVRIDIPPLTPTGPMEVAVITGDVVARGSFEILPRDMPWIEVVPDEIHLTGTSVAAQAQLEITGNNVAFTEAEALADGGVEDGGTRVDFPESPGLVVTAIDVDEIDPSLMHVDIIATEGTQVGTTILSVTTAGETVSAAFTVYPPEDGSAFMVPTPPRIERGSQWSAVAVRVFGAGAAFAEYSLGPSEAWIDEEGCDLERAERLSESELSIAVTVAPDFAGDFCTFHAVNGAMTLVSKIAVVDPERYMATILSPITQNADVFYRSAEPIEAGGAGPPVFDGDTTASVAVRSGVDVRGQMVNDDPAAALDILFEKVGGDAPLGWGRLRIHTNHYGDITTDYYVMPSIETPQNVVASPSSVPAEARDVVWHLESVVSSNASLAEDALTFDAGVPPTVVFDDPAIRADSVEVIDSRSALVHATLGAGISSDMAVMYVRSGNGKAAASVLLEPRSHFRARNCDPQMIARPDGEPDLVLVKVLVPPEGFGDSEIVGDVFDEIGVRALSAAPYCETENPDSCDELYLLLQVDPWGPSGWFGVLVTDGRERMVVPLFVDGDADSDSESLTMAIDLEEGIDALRPGDSGIRATARVPASRFFDASLIDFRTGIPGTYVRMTDLGPQGAEILIDVSADAEISSGFLPIFATTGEGATVGFAPFVDADRETLTDEEVNFLLDPVWNPVGICTLTPESPLSIIDLREGKTGSASVDAVLLSQDGLSPQGSSSSDLLWLVSNDSPDRILLRLSEGAPGGWSTVHPFAVGGAVSEEIEDDETDDDTPDTLGNPCVSPTLTDASIGAPLDADWYLVQTSTSACDAVAYAVARTAGDRPWESPDLRLELREASGGHALVDTAKDDPLTDAADPRLYFHLDAARSALVKMSPELGSAGRYFLHVRRNAVIREICRENGSGAAFIEIEIKPGSDLSQYSVQLVDPEAPSVPLASLALTGTAPSDGVVVIGEPGDPNADVEDTAGVTAWAPDDPFAVRLSIGAELVDAIQVDGTAGAGEGAPVSGVDEPVCYRRLAGIDTNDNASDFLGSWVSSPGA